MSFGFGVGDVLAAIQVVYTVYKKCHDAPGEIIEAMSDVKQMKTELVSMQQKTQDKNSPVYKNKGELLERVKETFDPIISDLERLGALIQEFRHIPPYSGKKIIFAQFKIPVVKDIRASLVKYTAIHVHALSHFTVEGQAELMVQNEALKKQVESVRKQQGDAQRVSKEAAKKMDDILKALGEMGKQKEKERKAVEKLKQKEQQGKDGKEVSVSKAAVAGMRGKEIQGEIEVMLKASGMGETEVKKVLAALMFDAIPPVSGTSTNSTSQEDVSGKKSTAKPKKKKEEEEDSTSNKLTVPTRPRGNSQPPTVHKPLSPDSDMSKKRATSPSPQKSMSTSPNTNLPAATSAKPSTSTISSKPRKFKGNSKIMCVDSSNGFRSLQSQAYLTLLRLWTANANPPAGSQWLFSTIASAGLWVPSPGSAFYSKTLKIRKNAIEHISGPESYFRSADPPFEKATALSTMLSLGLRKFDDRDLGEFDNVLCFDGKAYDALIARIVAMKAGAADEATPKKEKIKVKARVHLVSGTEWYDSSKHSSSQEQAEVTENLKTVLKAFLEKELGWVKPEKGIVCSIGGVETRTKKVEIEEKYWKKWEEMRKKKESGFEARALREMPGCFIRWEGLNGVVLAEEEQNGSENGENEKKGKEKKISGMCFLYITGPKDGLKAAEKWIKGMFQGDE